MAASWLPGGCGWPLSVYLVALVAQTVALENCPARIRLRVLPLVAATHLLYGLGFWRGLFTTLKPKDKPSDAEVKLENIPLA